MAQQSKIDEENERQVAKAERQELKHELTDQWQSVRRDRAIDAG